MLDYLASQVGGVEKLKDFISALYNASPAQQSRMFEKLYLPDLTTIRGMDKVVGVTIDGLTTATKVTMDGLTTASEAVRDGLVKTGGAVSKALRRPSVLQNPN
jgi:hypothetical protein